MACTKGFLLSSPQADDQFLFDCLPLAVITRAGV